MSTQCEVPMTDPLRATWEAYKLTEDYANTRRWACVPTSVDGSLWAAYLQGWRAHEAQAALTASPQAAPEGDTLRGALQEVITSARLGVTKMGPELLAYIERAMAASPQVQGGEAQTRCPLCGSSGLHACTGQPPRAWTEQEKADCLAAMQRIRDREAALGVDERRPQLAPCVSDEMVERACKKYAFREDGAVWPDDYSEHEVAAERVLMREFLEYVIASEAHHA